MVVSACKRKLQCDAEKFRNL